MKVQAEKWKQITQTDFRDYYKPKYSHSINRGWIDSFILRHRDNLTETKNAPQKNMNLKVPHSFLDETIRCLREHVQEIKIIGHYLDEIGIWEWEDWKDKKMTI
jgi:hypothetical protein